MLGGLHVSEITGAACINGEFLPIGDAKIWILDGGFFPGVLVYDTLSAREGCIFKLGAHVDRLFRSMQAVRIAIPQSKKEVGDLIVETVRRSGLRDAYIQCIVTRGPRSAAPIDRWTPTLIVYAIPYLGVVPPETIAAGAKLRTASVRNLPPQCLDPKIKHFNRLHFYLAQLEAMDAGADDVLLLDLDGYVSECRAANVFALLQGRLCTPAEGILLGITRQTVFEMAAREGVEAVQTRMTLHDFYNAEEVFACTTAGGIIPVVEVDGRRIGDGRPGKLSQRFEKLYWQLHVDSEYATPVYKAD